MVSDFRAPCTRIDEAKTATTVQLRNPRTIGRCPHGFEARLTPGGWTCFHNPAATPEPRRPAGHGAGLDGPVCPERQLPQFPDHDGPIRTRMCARCGRVTSRLDLDGVGWCGGDLPAVQGKPVRHLVAVGA